MIWVEYQLTSPSFLAAAIKAASAANAEPAASEETSTQAIVKLRRTMISRFVVPPTGLQPPRYPAHLAHRPSLRHQKTCRQIATPDQSAGASTQRGFSCNFTSI